MPKNLKSVKPHKKPGPPPEWTPEEMAAAIVAANGLVTHAAKRLGCAPATVVKYCHEHSVCQAARKEADERVLDFAEGKLMEAINAGNITANIFFLKCKGKPRGYTEQIHVTQTQDKVFEMRWVGEDAADE